MTQKHILASREKEYERVATRKEFSYFNDNDEPYT